MAFDVDAWDEPGVLGRLIAEAEVRGSIVSIGCDESGWAVNFVDDPDAD
jgi:hypothetical protein